MGNCDRLGENSSQEQTLNQDGNQSVASEDVADEADDNLHQLLGDQCAHGRPLQNFGDEDMVAACGEEDHSVDGSMPGAWTEPLQPATELQPDVLSSIVGRL